MLHTTVLLGHCLCYWLGCQTWLWVGPSHMHPTDIVQANFQARAQSAGVVKAICLCKPLLSYGVYVLNKKMTIISVCIKVEAWDACYLLLCHLRCIAVLIVLASRADLPTASGPHPPASPVLPSILVRLLMPTVVPTPGFSSAPPVFAAPHSIEDALCFQTFMQLVSNINPAADKLQSEVLLLFGDLAAIFCHLFGHIKACKRVTQHLQTIVELGSCSLSYSIVDTLPTLAPLGPSHSLLPHLLSNVHPSTIDNYTSGKCKATQDKHMARPSVKQSHHTGVLET